MENVHLLDYKSSLQDKINDFNNTLLEFSIKDRRKIKKHI